MWICPQCHAENREANVVCDSCGAPRSAGRFGAVQPRRAAAQSPRVSAAPAREVRDTRDQALPPSAVRNQYAAPDMDARPKPARRPAAALARAVGLVLCVLLPVLVGLLAWRQYDVLRPVVDSLFLVEDTPWLGLACYIACGVIAGLVALLPGLWTLLLARMARERR